MHVNQFAIAAIVAAAGVPFIAHSYSARSDLTPPRIIRVTDTVYVKAAPLDYDELARRVSARMPQSAPTVIDGDLIVKGRLGVGGPPEPNTTYNVTIHGPNSAELRFISNESLRDPQRTGNQHRHVGTLSLGQDGGLRLDQNSTCYKDVRGCIVDDRKRRRAYSGFDSMGDMSFYLAEVDTLTGKEIAPRAQSLVFRLIDWDKNIHIASHRPGQRIYFNSSTTLHASDRQWEIPFQ